MAAENKPGEWAIVDLKQKYNVRAVQVNYSDYHSNIYKSDSTVYTRFRLYASGDGKEWKIIVDLSKEKLDRPNAYIPLDKPEYCRYIKYEHIYVASPNLAISDIRIFGNGRGLVPATPSSLAARRHGDRRDATITWDRVPNVVGYNILWGIGPDKLYETYQVWADKGNTLELRALTKNQSYYFAIEAFNENGVSGQSGVIFCK